MQIRRQGRRARTAPPRLRDRYARRGKAARPCPAEPSFPPPRQPHRPDLVELSPKRRTAIVEGLGKAVEGAEGRLSHWQREFSKNLLDTIGGAGFAFIERQTQFIRDILATVRGRT